MYAYIHMYTDTYIYSCCKYMYKFVCIYSYIYMYMYTDTHINVYIYIHIYIFLYIHIHIYLLVVCVYIRTCIRALLYFIETENVCHACNPPAPMNHVKIFKVRPRQEAIFYWYTANTNHFHLTDSVRWK